MRVNDAIVGAILLILSLVVLWHVQSFPKIPGQPYGAALYPFTVGIGLAAVSVLLLVQGLRSGQSLLNLPAGAPRRLFAFWVTAGSLFFYIFFADRLGFIVCSSLMLAALFWSYGVRRVLVLPLAIGATLVIHLGFYKLLKVPLPWGVLQPLAW